MAYTLDEFRAPCDSFEEIARFLAEFVQDGELPNATPRDADPSVWQQRLRRWWHENPFCRPDALLGFGLRDTSGELIGFHGFIPHDYIVDSAIVPALIATTFFVRQSHRQAALALFIRVKRLGDTTHIVDGSPSREVQALLDRVEFQKSAPGSHHYRFIGGRRGFSLKAPIGNFAAWLTNRIGECSLGEYRLITSPEDIESVPDFSDAKLRKRVTKDGLLWLMKGTEYQRVFRGLCDGVGVLRAYMIARLKSKFGLRALRVVETGSFDGDDGALTRLLDFIATRSSDADLPANVDLMVWALLNSDPSPNWIFRKNWHPPLYFRIPKSLQGTEKVCQASEGDLLLL